MPALQHDVDERIGHNIHLRFDHQWDQFRHIVIVHRMHRCQVRPRHAPLQAKAHRLRGQSFHMARQWIIAFVAMQIDGQAAVGSQAAQRLHRSATLLHRAFKMRDAADNISPHIQGPRQGCNAILGAVLAVLRKGHDLQVKIGGDAALDL